MTRILVTGAAGFIGFHLSKRLLDEGFTVHGLDAMTDYYDVTLKEARRDILRAYPKFSDSAEMVESPEFLERGRAFAPEIILHLAAQAGVRYSLENPRSYVMSNVVGSFNVMELAREIKVQHLLMASTSSAYGANTKMPFIETDRADHPLTIYAATKKASEEMSHSYAHLWGIPTTMFRFFTVYGTWGRPDLALYKFVDGILDGRPIDIYNHGEMYRDFTYVDDLVQGIRLLMDSPPGKTPVAGDSLSPAAPWRLVNIGNGEKVKLTDFIAAIEAELGMKAKRNYMDMQMGDVPATWADNNLLKTLTGYHPSTSLQSGIAAFVKWYRDYYRV